MRQPAGLSGEQQSRIAIARVALQDKLILLLGEAFSGLKTKMIGQVLALASDRDLILLMITRNPQDARQIGGQTIVVSDGQAAPPQNIDTLLSDPPTDLRGSLAR